MTWQDAPYPLLLLLAFMLAFSLARYAYQRRPSPGAAPLALLMAAAAQWSLTYAFELSSVTLQAKLFWAKVEYLGIVILPVAWLLFALAYTGRNRWLTPSRLTLGLIIPLLTLVSAWTNDYHALLWSSVALDLSTPISVLDLSYGPVFWLHAAYAYLLLLLGSGFLLLDIFQRATLYRWQTTAVLAGLLFPWASNILYLSGRSPVPYLDLTPFTFTLSGTLLAWALVRFHLLDLVPIAREAVIESMPDAVLALDETGRIVYLNHTARALLEPGQEPIGLPVEQLLPLHLQSVWARDEHEGPMVLALSGGERYFELSVASSLRFGAQSGTVLVLRDITQRQKAEEALRLSEEQFRQLAENVQEVFWLTTMDPNEPIYISPAYEEIWGRSRESFVDEPGSFINAIHPEDRERVMGAQGQKLDGSYSEEYRIVRPDGTVRWVRSRAFLIRNAEGVPYRIAGISTDVTDRRLMEELLRTQATHDPLTLLYNRRYLEETLERELSRAERQEYPVGILLLDIDHFKQLNDSLGHLAGDRLLQRLGSYLRENVRGGDIACRYGGEEFVMILPETTAEVAARRAEELKEGIRQLEVEYRGERLPRVTASIGIASYPENGTTIPALIHAADMALYSAKADGRDRVRVAEADPAG